VSERGPGPAQPEGAPPTALGWYARMERQSSTPPTQAPSPSARTTPMPPATGPLHAAPPPRRRADGAAKPSAAPVRRRRPSSGLVWWTLGALVLVAAVVAIVLTNPEVDGTTASDSQPEQTAGVEDPADTPAPAVSTPGGTEEPTSAPATTDPVGTPTATPSGGNDPLGLGVAMTSPACDGTWVVILGSATDPATHADDVTALLSSNPEAKYVLTEGACSSLRQRTADGNQIYAVYLGPYPDQAAACTVSTGIGGGVYVKRMDDTTPSDQTWEC
jgi:hypothetical protein